jgi:RHS repeat-associated protein
VTHQTYAGEGLVDDIGTRESTVEYTHGMVELLTLAPGTPYEQIIDPVIDTRGRVTSTISSAGGQSRTVSFEYDPDEGLHLHKITNSHGDEHTVWTDPALGVPTHELDVSGTCQTREWDGLGTPRNHWVEGAQVDYEILHPPVGNQDPAARVLIVRETHNTGESSETHFNSLLQPFLSSGLLPDGGVAKTHRVFDGRGRIYDERDEGSDGAITSTRYFQYDNLDRLVWLRDDELPGVTRQIFYLGRLTVDADRRGVLHRSVVDQSGRVTETWVGPWALDKHGRVVLSHGAFGAVRTVDRDDDVPGVVKRAVISYEYDNPLGLVSKVIDPDSGTQDYDYSGFGELAWTSDLERGLVQYFYDDLGRLDSVQDPEGLTDFIYYEGEEFAGTKLKSASSDGVSVTYTYGARGQVDTEDWGIDTGPALEHFVVDYDYDDYGRLQSITSPQIDAATPPLEVVMSYGETGALDGVTGGTGASRVDWAPTDYDNLGRIKKALYANDAGPDMVAAYRHRPSDGALEVMHVRRVGESPDIMSVSYDWDGTGLLQSRTDHLENRHEIFGYDNQARLDMWTVQVDGQPSQVIQYGYDTLGNLTNYAGVTQSYDHPGAPHRLTQSGSSSLFDYDEVGRLKSDSWREFTYNRFDLPTNVQTSAYSVDFEYGPFGQRVLKKRFGDTTVYVSDLYERRQTQFETHHVFRVPGIAEVRWKANADGSYEEEVNYIHHDHLGSVALVSNGGSGVQTQRFAPFGRRMDEFGDVTGAPSNPQTPYGFTGHEHDDAAGLINMRGRVYDPTYGRMLTPDPLVSDAFSSGSWNPYSYVGNSPLSSIDPTGFGGCDVNSGICWNGGRSYRDPFDGEGGSGSGQYTHDSGNAGNGRSDLGGPGVHGESFAPWNDPKPPGWTPTYYYGPDLSTVDFSYDHNAGQPYTNQRRHSDNLGNFAGGFGDRPRYANAVIVGGPEIGFNRITQFLWDQLTEASPTFSLCEGDDCYEEPSYGGMPPFGPAGVGVGAQFWRTAPRVGGQALRAFTSGNFRTNLARLSGKLPSGSHAHHVLPQKFGRAFERAGINVNDPRFGAWWEAGGHLQNATRYNREWQQFLRGGQRSADDILQFGRDISGRYGLEIFF